MNELVGGDQAFMVYGSFDLFMQTKPKHKQDLFGLVYIVEIDSMVKIGRSSDPYRRINEIRLSYGRGEIGRVAVSMLHKNYPATESFLHRYFKRFRVRETEVFDLGFDLALDELQICCFDFDVDIEKARRESQAKKERISEYTKEMFEKSRLAGVKTTAKLTREDMDKAFQRLSEDDFCHWLYCNEMEDFIDVYFPLTEQDVIDEVKNYPINCHNFDGLDEYIFDYIDGLNTSEERKKDLFSALLRTTKDNLTREKCKIALALR